MLNLNNPVKFSKKHRTYIRKLGNLEYEYWDSKKKINIEIKESIKKQLLFWQKNKCAYCGLKLGGTSRIEIEHIAPRHLYPNFEYTTKNLVISCQYCNSSSKKGKKITVKSCDKYYNKCVFTIVHPYYDDVDRFFESKGAIICICTGLSDDEEEKAKNTIEMFGLSEPSHVEIRAMQLSWEMQRKENTLDELYEKLLKKTSTYVSCIGDKIR